MRKGRNNRSLLPYKKWTPKKSKAINYFSFWIVQLFFFHQQQPSFTPTFAKLKKSLPPRSDGCCLCRINTDFLRFANMTAGEYIRSCQHPSIHHHPSTQQHSHTEMKVTAQDQYIFSAIFVLRLRHQGQTSTD